MNKYKWSKYYIFMFIFLMYFIPKYFEYTTFMNLKGVAPVISLMKLGAYALALVWWSINILVPRKIPIYYYLIAVILLIYFTYEAFIKDRNNIFVVLLFSLIFEENYINKYIKDVLNISIFLYGLTIISCLCGAIENVYTDRNKFGSVWTGGGWGFKYSGQLVMMLMPIVFLYYYKKGNRIKWYDNLFWIIVNILVFMLCRTIMGFGLIMLFIVLFNGGEIFKKKGIKTIFDKRYIRVCPYFCAIATGVMLLLYKNHSGIGIKLDSVLNGRLSLGISMMEKYGVSMLGTSFVNSTDPAYEILDSEYMHMLVGEGIVYLLIALVLCQFLLTYSQKKKDIYLTLIYALMMFNAMFNNGIFNLVMNPFGIVLAVSIKKALRKTC